jgi:hypothetical protein
MDHLIHPCLRMAARSELFDLDGTNVDLLLLELALESLA